MKRKFSNLKEYFKFAFHFNGYWICIFCFVIMCKYIFVFNAMSTPIHFPLKRLLFDPLWPSVYIEVAFLGNVSICFFLKTVKKLEKFEVTFLWFQSVDCENVYFRKIWHILCNHETNSSNMVDDTVKQKFWILSFLTVLLKELCVSSWVF